MRWVVLASVMAACGPAHVAGEQSFAPVVDEGVVSLLDAAPVGGTPDANLADDIVLHFSAAMDASSTLHAVQITPSLDCTASVIDSEYRCQHAPFAPATHYTVSVLTSALDSSGHALDQAATFSFTSAIAGAPVITALSVAGQPGHQINQGAGLLALDLAGTGFEKMTARLVGDTASAASANGGTSATLFVRVSHGQAPGPLALSLVNSVGSATTAILRATFITSDATLGDDLAAGTSEAPFRTLTRALHVSGSGDTVLLAAGTYSAGETWATANAANVPDGVRVQGHDESDTLLTPLVADTAVAFHFAGEAQVSNLSAFGFFRAAIADRSADVSLVNVRLHANLDAGLWVADAARVSFAGEADHNLGAGLSARDDARIDAANASLHDNTTGASLQGSAHLSAALSEFSNNDNGIVVAGTGAASAVSVSGCTFSGNAIGLTWSGAVSTLSVNQTTFTNNKLALSDASGTATSTFSGVSVNGTIYPTENTPLSANASNPPLWQLTNGATITFE